MQNVSWLLAVSAVLTAIASISAQDTRRPLTITLSSATDILITRADGKRFGRDASGTTFREIPDAEIIRSPGREPVYDIPPGESTGPLTLKLSGREPVKDAKLAITGPGFVFGVNGISLRKGSVVDITFSPTGGMLEYTSNASGPAPRIVLGTDPVDPKQPSYIFELHRSPFRTDGVKFRLEYEEQRTLTFGADAAPGVVYDLKLTRLNGDGTESVFSAPSISGGKQARFVVDLVGIKTTPRICPKTDPDAGKAPICVPMKKTT